MFPCCVPIHRSVCYEIKRETEELLIEWKQMGKENILSAYVH